MLLGRKPTNKPTKESFYLVFILFLCIFLGQNASFCLYKSCRLASLVRAEYHIPFQAIDDDDDDDDDDGGVCHCIVALGNGAGCITAAMVALLVLTSGPAR